MLTLQEMKASLTEAVERDREELLELSRYIHANPELSFREYKAAAQLTGLLKELPVTLTFPYGGLETAFRADCKGALGDGPTVAILAEYDALPDCGHGCGHNLIAAAAYGAFRALVSMKEHFAGTVSFIGTPAEEFGGGKVKMLRAGAFDGIDFAMMIHPSDTKPYIARPAMACTHINLIYHGKAAHSSTPARGIDALSAMRAFLSLLDIVRPTLPTRSLINSVIQEGGSVGNIICDRCRADLSVRANTLTDLQKGTDAIHRCIKAAADVIGATFEIEQDELYAERYSNRPMDEAYSANLASLGLKTIEANPNGLFGSSDSGNLSMVLPLIHEYLPISDHAVEGHTRAFADAAISELGQNAAILGAKAMALTSLDLLTDEELRGRCRAYFEEQIPERYRKQPQNG